MLSSVSDYNLGAIGRIEVLLSKIELKQQQEHVQMRLQNMQTSGFRPVHIVVAAMQAVQHRSGIRMYLRRTS
jgi:hypothetical protein